MIDNEGNLCVKENFDTKMTMMARNVKQRLSKVYTQGKQGLRGRQDSPEIKIELPRLASPPSLPSPSLMPTLDLFCLRVLHL